MLIIFDWDGTLCDSVGRIVEAMCEAARQQTAPVPTEAAVRDIIGLGLHEATARLFPGLPLEARDALRQAYSSVYRELDRDPPKLFAGAREVLDELRSVGHRLAIATGKSRRGLDRVLQGLDVGHLFHASRCADECHSKPHPQMLRELLAQLGFEQADSLMIGDSELDLEMAHAAGIDRIGVSYGVHAAERLQQWDPLAVLDTLPGLLSLPRLSVPG